MTNSPQAALAFALAQPEDQPDAGFAALQRLAEAEIGARLFTVLAFDFPRQVMVRRFSTNTAIYPVGVEDPITDTIWERTLIGARQPLVLNSPAEMATLLPNVPELAALGCEAMLNLPVVVAGQALGAINLLERSGRYTPERVATAQALLAPAAAAILLWIERREN